MFCFLSHSYTFTKDCSAQDIDMTSVLRSLKHPRGMILPRQKVLYYQLGLPFIYKWNGLKFIMNILGPCSVTFEYVFGIVLLFNIASSQLNISSFQKHDR